VRVGVWIAAVLLAGVADVFDRDRLGGALLSTAGPFITLAIVISAGSLCDHLGLFRVMAKTFIPTCWSGWRAFAAALAFTAVLSGLVNLDVAVVIAMPVAIDVAARNDLPGGWMAVSVALTANATSFLLPTSNVTTLLVLSRCPIAPLSYVHESWLAWFMVAVPTVLGLAAVLAPRSEAGRPTGPIRGGRGGALVDLPPMCVAASAVRALLGRSLVARGGFATQAARLSVLAAAVNNLPAAAALRTIGSASRWAAVLAMAIGPNLLLSGSIATLICRRIALERGVRLTAARLTVAGLALVPAQLLLATIGLRLTGAIR